ncbi:MAG: aldo/keto reductase, partial [Frankia sp.]
HMAVTPGPVETVRTSALTDLAQTGQIRYIGCSNLSAWQLMKALGVSERRNLHRYSSQQISYSLLGREVENEFLPLARDQGLATLAASPLGGGLLAGPPTEGNPGFGRTRGVPTLHSATQIGHLAEVVRGIADARGVSGAQIGLAWVLARPGITAAIVRTGSVEHLEECVTATGLTLSDVEVTELDAASRLRIPYPYWNQEKYNAERRGTGALPVTRRVPGSWTG